MNPTLRRVITAGLGSLAMTEQAVRRLVDDLVTKGDITRSEGERIFADLERRWADESVQLGERWEKGRQRLEQVIAAAVSVALDRVGLVRKSEIARQEPVASRGAGTKGRGTVAKARVRRRKKATPTAR